jgi:EAL domain-containing protein (putative c-di-GMP-specific phosphodiesterase class I)
MELLRKMGCHYGQGFFYSRPLNVDSFEEKVEELNNYLPSPS